MQPVRERIKNRTPTSPWTFMIEQYSVTGKHVIRFSKIDRDPVRVEFCTA